MRTRAFFAALILLVAVATRSETAQPNAKVDRESIPVESIVPTSNVQVTKQQVNKWRRVVHGPHTRSERAGALHLLFAHGIVFDDVRKELVDLGLEYNTEELRRIAIHHLGYILRDDMDRFVPICRDGLNDPDPEVRRLTLDCLAHAWNDPSWMNETRAGPMPYPVSESTMNVLLDEICSKALFDENELVHGLAQSFLDDSFVKPNRFRLRSLQRACERAVSTKKITYAESMQLQAPWNVAVNGGTLAKPHSSPTKDSSKATEPALDPFGERPIQPEAVFDPLK